MWISRRVGAAPDRCFFIDGTAANVTAARDAGMTGFHYRQLDELRAALAQLPNQ
ncbi:hypothetical protein [Streptomyces sp. CBMA152]|uniref:hypothetical protein n=1 Tax=Streptomyces sp. CBMA152 TaxID=1896312 RepID=UPI0016600927|nr:hypothetical protein [Streptomyces sp. CBMA152]